MNVTADDRQGQRGIAAFLGALQSLGWSDGRNVQIDIRWGVNNLDRQRNYAAELATLTPEVILASGTISVNAIQHVSRTLPIVFVRVADPVGAGFVSNLARPGGNVTGFMLFEYSLSGKWLELLKQAAPHVARVAVLRDPDLSSGIALFGAIQNAAQSLGKMGLPTRGRMATPGSKLTEKLKVVSC
jgi:putative ABC transport system substrate-binding protein